MKLIVTFLTYLLPSILHSGSMYLIQVEPLDKHWQRCWRWAATAPKAPIQTGKALYQYQRKKHILQLLCQWLYVRCEFPVSLFKVFFSKFSTGDKMNISLHKRNTIKAARVVLWGCLQMITVVRSSISAATEIQSKIHHSCRDSPAPDMKRLKMMAKQTVENNSSPTIIINVLYAGQ